MFLTFHPHTHQLRRGAAALSCSALLLAGCGGSDDSTNSASAASTSPTASDRASAPASDAAVYPMTVKAANGPVTVTAKPNQIVSLSAVGTEMLFAIGAGEQVKAVDDQSNYPTTAPRTKLSGFQPNLEAIAAYDPDLVVVSNDIKGVVAGLGKLKIPVMLAPAAATVKDSYAQMEQLGALTGHVAEAAQASATMERALAAAVAKAPKRPGTTVYHELGPDLYSANSRTFIGSLYKQLGLTNIADEAPKSAGDYPKLAAEFVLTADPDLVLLADTKCCKQSAATVAKRPGWAKLKAVRTGNVVPLDDDVASRWGPRIVELVEVVASRLARLPAPAPTG